jgi:hypothetical protein
MEFHEGILSRSTFGIATDLAEAREARIAGPWVHHGAAGGALEQITDEVMRRLSANGPVDPELIREAVGDALEGRRPRW